MFCPNCGKQIPDGSKFCPYCGAKIGIVEGIKPDSKKYSQQGNTGERVVNKEKRKKNLAIIIIPIVVVFLAASIFIYFNFFPRISPEKSKDYENKGLTTLNTLAEQNQLFDEKKIQEAQNDFKNAVKYDPDNLSARKNLIYTYLVSDNYTEALNEVNAILAKNPNDAFALKMKELLNEETP